MSILNSYEKTQVTNLTLFAMNFFGNFKLM